jgi:hypothetical protein
MHANVQFVVRVGFFNQWLKAVWLSELLQYHGRARASLGKKTRSLLFRPSISYDIKRVKEPPLLK